MEPTTKQRNLLAVPLLAATVALLGACAVPSGGTVITTGVTYSGQFSIISPASYFFDGTGGDRLTVDAVYIDDSDGSSHATDVVVVAPDGSQLTAVRNFGRTFTVELPATGRYRLELRYPNADPFVHRYYLKVALDEDGGPAPFGLLDGPSIMAGQMVVYTYAGTAGERLNSYRATIVDPSGGPVPENGLLMGQVTLPVDGTYRVEVVQSGAALTQDLVGGAIQLGLTSTPPLLDNQHIAYSYAGSAGEPLGVIGGHYRVVAPDGSAVVGDTIAGERLVLPSDGTYSVVVTAYPFGDADPESTDLWLSHDYEVGPIAPGVTTPPADRLPGQSLSYTYAGTAGEELWVRTMRFLPLPTCPDQSFPGGFYYVTQAVYAPDGSRLGCTAVDDGTYSWLVYDLPVTGTYDVVITPKVADKSFEIGVASYLP